MRNKGSANHRELEHGFYMSFNNPRNFRLAFTEIDMLKDKLGLPDSIIEQTAYIYRKAQQKNLAEVDLRRIAEVTEGFSGADVSAVANTAVSLVPHKYLGKYFTGRSS